METALLRNISSSLILIVVFLLSLSEAREFLVGGKTGSWKIPSSSSQSTTLNQWAESSRFRIGDTLVLSYDKEKDSVLQVSEEAYKSCNTSNAVAEYKDGNTKVNLDRSGPFYFISGAEGHCAKSQKLVVVVMSPRPLRHFVISPAPGPSSADGPAVAPTSAGSSLQATIAMAVAAVFGFGVLIM
ncbi:hypothetical protein ACFE04_016851 [Oxalis oulophora]